SSPSAYAPLRFAARLEFSGRRFRNALDADGTPGFVSQFQDDPLKQNPSFGDLESLRHTRQETADDRFDLAANYTVVRSGKPCVAQEGCAAWKNLFIGGLGVSMGAHYGADSAIQHACQRDFLRSRFGMKIDENQFRRLQPLQFGQHTVERSFQRGHESASLKINDSYGGNAIMLEQDSALARGAWGIIQRPNEARFICEQFDHILLIPQMIAAGDDINPGSKDFLRGFNGDPRTPGGVFPVGHDHVQRVALTEFGHQLPDGAPAGLTDNIGDKQQFHRPTVPSAQWSASGFKPERRAQIALSPFTGINLLRRIY